MRRLSVYATMVLATSGAQATEHGFGQAVCIHNRELVNNFVMAQAEAVVTEVFRRADVRIEWLSTKQCRTAREDALRIEMDPVVPAHFGPATMAYALPYGVSGTSIHVFHDRVMQNHRDQRGQVLGYVMAHEMGHVLQGIARHSSSGLMRAYWGMLDYSRMSKYQLPFSTEDVELIHMKMQHRADASLAAHSER